ncbi:MAG: hypothetical protein L0Y72_25830 [Gemmataceae bacterium]|nr:hypothetical protein [Gemmataceae bacterium]MCI0742467.1 hypothetical protein [Gemmataceae bacterium]
MVFCVALAGLAGAGVTLLAQQAAPESAKAPDLPRHDGPEAKDASGKVLLLSSERTMEGDILRVGEQFRIRRGQSEVWLPADKALRLCADWNEAYMVMRTRANLGDPDERLRLARWCQVNSLREQALVEAKVALEMRPEHQETRKLVTILERAVNSSPRPSGVGTGLRGHQDKPAGPTPHVDLSNESYAVFMNKVQPILMNTCVNCHSGGEGGAFQLLRTAQGGQRGATMRNLAAVIAQVNLENPSLSPLLVKSVSPHGPTGKSPIISRKDLPYRSLQHWVEQLVATHPHLRESAKTAKSSGVIQAEFGVNARPLPPPPVVPLVPTPAPEAKKDSAKKPAAGVLPGETVINNRNSIVPAQKTNAAPAPAPMNQNQLDVVDPNAFNQAVHGGKK